MLKDSWIRFGLISVMVLMLTACGSEELNHVEESHTDAESVEVAEGLEDESESIMTEEMLPEGDAQLYEQYMDTIDEEITLLQGNVQIYDEYKGKIDAISLYSPYYEPLNPEPEEIFEGQYSAFYEEGVIKSMHVSFTGLENQSYAYYNLDSISYYASTFSGWGTMDLPEYLANMDILRYTNYEYNKYLYAQYEADDDWISRIGIDDVKSEFCVINETIYMIDRDRQLLCPVGDGKFEAGNRIVQWMNMLEDRTYGQFYVNEENHQKVASLVPEGYIFGEQNGIAAGDINGDGYPEYIACLYPDDYDTEYKRYEYGSPYEHIPEYYASQFWLFESNDQGVYQAIQLTDTIECDNEILTMLNVNFISDKELEIEYFIGRSPYENRLYRYQYEPEDKAFYLTGIIYREGYDGAVWEMDEDVIGLVSMKDFYMKDGETVKGIDISPEHYYKEKYGTQSNLLDEQHKKIMKYCEDKWMETEPKIYSEQLYYNGKCYSLFYNIYSDGETGNSCTNVLVIDVEKNKVMNMTDIISQEELLELYRYAVYLSTFERPEQDAIYEHTTLLSEKWEDINTEQSEIRMYLTQDGLVIYYDSLVERVLIQKEYLAGTELVKYYE